MPDIALEPDKTIQKVRDRFCLNLSEEQAVQNLQQLMEESISALFPQMVEQIHRWAQVRGQLDQEFDRVLGFLIRSIVCTKLV